MVIAGFVGWIMIMVVIALIAAYVWPILVISVSIPALIICISVIAIWHIIITTLVRVIVIAVLTGIAASHVFVVDIFHAAFIYNSVGVIVKSKHGYAGHRQQAKK